jgi:hypothetical protein
MQSQDIYLRGNSLATIVPEIRDDYMQEATTNLIELLQYLQEKRSLIFSILTPRLEVLAASLTRRTMDAAQYLLQSGYLGFADYIEHRSSAADKVYQAQASYLEKWPRMKEMLQRVDKLAIFLKLDQMVFSDSEGNQITANFPQLHMIPDSDDLIEKLDGWLRDLELSVKESIPDAINIGGRYTLLIRKIMNLQAENRLRLLSVEERLRDRGLYIPKTHREYTEESLQSHPLLLMECGTGKNSVHVNEAFLDAVHHPQLFDLPSDLPWYWWMELLLYECVRISLTHGKQLSCPFQGFKIYIGKSGARCGGQCFFRKRLEMLQRKSDLVCRSPYCG